MGATTSRTRWGTVVALVAVAMAAPSDAAACGACFNPVGSPAPVTAHRMVLSISTRQTTLWDQIQYSGAPADFVWVLPVRGTPMVELADEGFFEALTIETQITMQGPTPPNMFCPSSGTSFACGAAGGAPVSASDAGSRGVTVFSEGVVGPYETATIGAEDPMALVEWLQDHDYAVDDSMLPIIAAYGGVGANFAVLRLRPNEGIDRMQPVRITSPGLSTVLPLRMVAAGVALTVDLELFVFAESRMEVANYGNAEVDRAAIVYDWATSTFSYEEAFDDALFLGTGTVTNWVTEHARSVATYSLSGYVAYGPDGEMRSAAADTAIATDGIPTPYLTRLRTRLSPRELDRDLVLRASEGGDLENFFSVTREVNRPEPVRCGSGCSAAVGGGSAPALVAMALVPVALMMRRRRRR